HVATGEVDVEVLDDAHHTGGAGGVAVGRHGHVVHLEGQGDVAGQVGHEHGRTLEHTDEQRGPVVVVSGDLRTQLRHPGLQGLGVHHDLTEIWAVDQVGGTRLRRHTCKVSERGDR